MDTMTSVMQVQVNRIDSKDYDNEDKFIPWDNPDNIITFETFSAVENAFTCYFNPLIFCFSIPANILNCIVFSLQGSYSCSISSFSSPSRNKLMVLKQRPLGIAFTWWGCYGSCL